MGNAFSPTACVAMRAGGGGFCSASALRIAGMDQVKIVGNKGAGSVAGGKLGDGAWKGGQPLPKDFLAPVRDRLPAAVRGVK